MSKTYRNIPKDRGYHRKPKGAKKAKINNCRKGAIPPDSYDDINYNNEVSFIYNLIYTLYNDGYTIDQIYHKMKNKGYKITINFIKDLVN
jgi:hypothetical protein